jgi:hypothetical protein
MRKPTLREAQSFAQGPQRNECGRLEENPGLSGARVRPSDHMYPDIGQQPAAVT